MANDRDFHVLIVGGGFAGVGAAIRLKQAGIHHFALLEKAEELGGVWRDNTYPGCACDVPSALYSYSFAPNPNWSRLFATQEEIKAYLQSTAAVYGVDAHTRLQTEALGLYWEEEAQQWRVDTSKGTFRSRFVILACGPIHEPVMPDIEGLEGFAGEVFHSSRWRHDLDLRGKRVAVVGTGASAIQFVPEIESKVQALTVFQRTAHWVLPKVDSRLPAAVRAVFEHLPLTQTALRAAVFGIFESINGGLQSKALMSRFQILAKWNIHRAVKDPALRKRLTPSYVMGCKRILQSSDWYPALAKPHVKLVDSGLARVEGNTLHAVDGTQADADVLIFATGFEIAEPPIARRVHGRDGRSMAQVWQGSPQGYLGTLVEGCPNAFLMFGPNIAVSSSAFLIIEAQLQLIVDALQQAEIKRIRSLEADPHITFAYNERLQNALKTTVWNTGGCHSYFIDRNGRNSTVWPWTTFKMRQALKRFKPQDYRVKF